MIKGFYFSMNTFEIFYVTEKNYRSEKVINSILDKVAFLRDLDLENYNKDDEIIKNTKKIIKENLHFGILEQKKTSDGWIYYSFNSKNYGASGLDCVTIIDSGLGA